MIISWSMRKRLWPGRLGRMYGLYKWGKGELQMKNALKKRLPAVFVGMLLAVLAAGCGNGEGEIYPLTVDGTAITVDVTTMQTI